VSEVLVSLLTEPGWFALSDGCDDESLFFPCATALLWKVANALWAPARSPAFNAAATLERLFSFWLPEDEVDEADEEEAEEMGASSMASCFMAAAAAFVLLAFRAVSSVWISLAILTCCATAAGEVELEDDEEVEETELMF
jgi:hypothetical protein